MNEQETNIKFGHIKNKDVKNYITKEETFAVPSNGSVARITITGLPADYSALQVLYMTDNYLGFPNWLAEKPHPNHK